MLLNNIKTHTMNSVGLVFLEIKKYFLLLQQKVFLQKSEAKCFISLP